MSVIDLAEHRQYRNERRLRKPVAVSHVVQDSKPGPSYRDLWAQIRGLRKLRGFGTDEHLMAMIQPTYERLCALALESAPSPAMFRKDCEIALQCQTR